MAVQVPYNDLVYRKDLARREQIRYDMEGLNTIYPNVAGNEVDDWHHLMRCKNNELRKLDEAIKDWEHAQERKSRQDKLLIKARQVMTGQ